jgi:hypothetical protein
MSNEREPLLSQDSQDNDIVQHHTYDDRASVHRPKKTPLPKLQLFLVIALQFAEPVTGTVIYPFINQLVRETGVTGGDERRTGYYAGVIVSLSTPDLLPPPHISARWLVPPSLTISRYIHRID